MLVIKYHALNFFGYLYEFIHSLNSLHRKQFDTHWLDKLMSLRLRFLTFGSKAYQLHVHFSGSNNSIDRIGNPGSYLSAAVI